MRTLKTNVAEHLEVRLGPVDYGWGDPASGKRLQVVRFKDQPEPGVDTYATLGLSEYVLAMQTGREVREELVLCATDRVCDKDVASILLWIAERCVDSGDAILRGQIIDLGAALAEGGEITALYATNPSVFDDRLLAIDSEQPPLVFVWLIPVTTREAAFVRERGWRAFEAALEEEDPDIWNMERRSVAAAIGST